MNALKSAIAGLALIAVATPSSADVITDWNQAAMDVMKAVNVAGNPWTRTLAMMHVAMSDAVNAVHNRYTRFTPDIPAAQNASAEAAAASAAREILMRQYPGQKARIDCGLYRPCWRACLTIPPGRPALLWARKSGPQSSPTARTTRQTHLTRTAR